MSRICHDQGTFIVVLFHVLFNEVYLLDCIFRLFICHCWQLRITLFDIAFIISGILSYKKDKVLLRISGIKQIFRFFNPVMRPPTQTNDDIGLYRLFCRIDPFSIIEKQERQHDK